MSLQDFHFLRPAWLVAVPLLWLVVAWLARRRRAESGPWSRLIDAELLERLQLAGTDTGGRTPWPWLALAWTLAPLALAGPSWERDSAPAYRAPAAWVVVLDLSPSMAAADVTPTRATRARYAIEDLLGAAHDARVALVVFSDEAYTVTPLTDDVATVRALLDPLAPGILPSAGDHLAPALTRADDLLERVGAAGRGRVIVLSDGFDDPAAAFGIAAKLKAAGTLIDVVGIGTGGGAPVRNADGSFVLDAQGHSALARLDADRLQRLASAGGGRYAGLAQLPAFVAALEAPVAPTAEAEKADLQVVHWRDAGAFLLPLVLAAAMVLARRGWL
jgi:Ca-activated chloride channel family protein